MKPLSARQSVLRDRGATLGLFVVGTAVCGALLAGLLFFFNDRFRARTLSVVQDIQRWTPEDIRQDPFRYLVSVADRTESILDRLSEKRNSLAVMNDRYQSVRGEADSNLVVVVRPLEELKETYRTAEANDRWPEAIAGVIRGREWVREQIVTLHQQKLEQLGRIAAVDTEASPWEVQLSLVEDAMSDCEQQLARIDAVRMLLKEDPVSDKLLSQLVNMEQVIDASHATLLALESGGVRRRDGTVEELADVDELAFEAILKE
ncbi:MAG: hypothetical protein V2A76_17770 [Planctomycetota bacterium]